MQTNSNQNRTREEILRDEKDTLNFSISWDRMCQFENTFQFKWKGEDLKISIKAFFGNGPGGFRTAYIFTYKCVSYEYLILDSYMKGISGKLPEITSDLNRLVIKAMPTSITIKEAPLVERENGVFPELNELCLFNETRGGVNNTFVARFEESTLYIEGKTIDFRDGGNHSFHFKLDEQNVALLYNFLKVEYGSRRDLLESMKKIYGGCGGFQRIRTTLRQNKIRYKFYSSKKIRESNCPNVVWYY